MLPPAPALDLHPVYGISARASRARDREHSLLNLGTIRYLGELSRHESPQRTTDTWIEHGTSGAAEWLATPTAVASYAPRRTTTEDSDARADSLPDRGHGGFAPDEQSAALVRTRVGVWVHPLPNAPLSNTATPRPPHPPDRGTGAKPPKSGARGRSPRTHKGGRVGPSTLNAPPANTATPRLPPDAEVLTRYAVAATCRRRNAPAKSPNSEGRSRCAACPASAINSTVASAISDAISRAI